MKKKLLGAAGLLILTPAVILALIAVALEGIGHVFYFLSDMFSLYAADPVGELLLKATAWMEDEKAAQPATQPAAPSGTPE